MRRAFATVENEDGVVARSADVDGLMLAELDFPPGYVQDEFEPDLPYLAVVLAGHMVKTFRSRTIELETGAAVTMPSGAAHGARFGSDGARIVIVKPRGAADCLDRLVELRACALSWLAWKLAAELRASDSAAPLAAEGLALELLAATTRGVHTPRRSRPPAWLHTVEELLHDGAADRVGLTELGKAVGVHPTHLARVFRARHGVTVGEYSRRLRLERAAADIAATDLPLACIATRAGFADQSHFTRLFKRYVGTTPARYRQMLGSFQGL